MSKQSHIEHLVKIRAVIQQAIALEKGNRVEVDGVRLHASEIHVLLLVDAGHGTNATRMAERLGITKGAVSQTLSRLEKKGLLTKQHDPSAKNELTLRFTPLGKKAAKRCQKVQDAIQGKFEDCLSAMSRSERQVTGRFLEEMARILRDASEDI
jgi:DNA-binding MarR family transcriptional regulator